MFFQKLLGWLVVIAIAYGIYAGRAWEFFIPEKERPRQPAENSQFLVAEQMRRAGAHEKQITPQISSLSLLPEGSWIERKALQLIQPTLEKKIEEQLVAARRVAGYRNRHYASGNRMDLRILSTTGGEGQPLSTGSKVGMLLTIWYVNGDEMFKRVFPITLGTSKLPPAFAEGIKGLRLNETRMLLIPPTLLTRSDDDALGRTVVFPRDEVVIAEVQLVKYP